MKYYNILYISLYSFDDSRGYYVLFCFVLFFLFRYVYVSSVSQHRVFALVALGGNSLRSRSLRIIVIEFLGSEIGQAGSPGIRHHLRYQSFLSEYQDLMPEMSCLPGCC